jgi:hypothetical protein
MIDTRNQFHTDGNCGFFMTKVPIEIKDDNRFERSHDQVSRNVAGETLIVPVRGGVGDLDSIYMLRQVAQLIWQMLADGKTVAEMVAGVEAEFEVDHDRAKQDMKRFLGELMDEGLIRPKR